MNPEIPQPFRTEQPRKDKRLIDKSPLMRVLRILASESREELASFDLEILRQRGGLEIRLLELELGALVLIEFENDVGKALEIRINRSIQCDFGIAHGEAALDQDHDRQAAAGPRGRWPWTNPHP